MKLKSLSLIYARAGSIIEDKQADTALIACSLCVCRCRCCCRCRSAGYSKICPHDTSKQQLQLLVPPTCVSVHTRACVVVKPFQIACSTVAAWRRITGIRYWNLTKWFSESDRTDAGDAKATATIRYGAGAAILTATGTGMAGIGILTIVANKAWGATIKRIRKKVELVNLLSFFFVWIIDCFGELATMITCFAKVPN